MLQTTSGSWYI